jgi:hypothetical protein
VTALRAKQQVEVQVQVDVLLADVNVGARQVRHVRFAVTPTMMLRRRVLRSAVVLGVLGVLVDAPIVTPPQLVGAVRVRAVQRGFQVPQPVLEVQQRVSRVHVGRVAHVASAGP